MPRRVTNKLIKLVDYKARTLIKNFGNNPAINLYQVFKKVFHAAGLEKEYAQLKENELHTLLLIPACYRDRYNAFRGIPASLTEINKKISADKEKYSDSRKSIDCLLRQQQQGMSKEHYQCLRHALEQYDEYVELAWKEGSQDNINFKMEFKDDHIVGEQSWVSELKSNGT